MTNQKKSIKKTFRDLISTQLTNCPVCNVNLINTQEELTNAIKCTICSSHICINCNKLIIIGKTSSYEAMYKEFPDKIAYMQPPTSADDDMLTKYCHYFDKSINSPQELLMRKRRYNLNYPSGRGQLCPLFSNTYAKHYYLKLSKPISLSVDGLSKQLAMVRICHFLLIRWKIHRLYTYLLYKIRSVNYKRRKKIWNKCITCATDILQYFELYEDLNTYAMNLSKMINI